MALIWQIVYRRAKFNLTDLATGRQMGKSSKRADRWSPGDKDHLPINWILGRPKEPLA